MKEVDVKAAIDVELRKITEAHRQINAITSQIADIQARISDSKILIDAFKHCLEK